jgi:hypothetical protein
MRVVCAWCLKEGRPALVNEKEPFEDADETHGVCALHKAILGVPDDLSIAPDSVGETDAS